MDFSKVTVVVPCHNEGHTVARVIEGLQTALPRSRVFVVDNASTDNTAAVAASTGAHVLEVAALGKGNAVRAALAQMATEVVLLIDGDATYDATQARALVVPILRGDVDMVTGDRLSHPASQAFLPFRQGGNLAITFIVNVILGTKCHDVLSGYRALSSAILDRMDLHSEGFEIETEILCLARGMDSRMVDVPIAYKKRHVLSHSKLIPIRDAVRILATAWRLRPR
jgi:glycosyltransferase involved in cell wall biosynthesis